MIYYPMSVLMNACIRDILIIFTLQDAPCFQNLQGDDYQIGVNLTNVVRTSSDGLAQVFIIGNDIVAMLLGDSIFVNHGLKKWLKAAVESAESRKGVTVFGYYVDDLERFGIGKLINAG